MRIILVRLRLEKRGRLMSGVRDKGGRKGKGKNDDKKLIA